MSDVDLEYEKQKILIENLISNPDLFSLCSNIVKAKYFLPELRNTVKFILDYYDQYNNIPSPKVIRAETGEKLEVSEIGLSSDEFEYSANELETFCRQRAVLSEVIAAQKYIEKQDYGALTERLQEAVLISLQRDLGTNIFEGIEERIRRRNEERSPISTGYPNVDAILGGGVVPSELLMASANSGGGKSIFLSNLSLNVAKQGHDVLYISLELSEDMVADRFETMITGWNKQTKIERAQETAHKITEITSKGWGKIYVKYMEAETTCANDIKAYLKQFELQYKKLPKMLVVDYLDIFGTNEKQVFSNVYEKDKIASTQLRAIGNNPRNPMIMATASQQNRSAVNETELNHSHIAGGMSKINTVDIYFSIIMTDAMRAEGVADFLFLKTRSSGGVGKTAHMNWDEVRLLFTSMNEVGELKLPQGKKAKNSDSIPSAAEKEVGGLAELLEM